MEDLHFSARAHDRILKVARTIANLAEAATLRRAIWWGYPISDPRPLALDVIDEGMASRHKICLDSGLVFRLTIALRTAP